MSKRKVLTYSEALDFLQRQGYRVYNGEEHDHEKAKFFIQVLDCIYTHPENKDLYVVYRS